MQLRKRFVTIQEKPHFRDNIGAGFFFLTDKTKKEKNLFF